MEAEIADRELIESSKNGDKKAFENLVKRYWKKAYFSALAFVRSPEDAMDLSQEAFIKTYRAISSFDTTRDFFPWFYTILKNLCLNHCRRSSKTVMRSVDEMLEKGLDFKDPDHGPDRALETKETRRALWKALLSLDEEQREIIFLREFRELSYAEIAHLLGCPMGTVMSRLYYARKALRSRLNGLI